MAKTKIITSYSLISPQVIKEENTENEIGLFSVGMEVEDIKTTVEELKYKGAKFTLEPTQTPVEILAFIEDPNGVRIALIQH